MDIYAHDDLDGYAATDVERYDGDLTEPEPCCVCLRSIPSRWNLRVVWHPNDDGWEYGTAGPAFCEDCARVISRAWQQRENRAGSDDRAVIVSMED